MGRGVNNVVRIPCKLDSTFFRAWFMFLKPFHHLTDREIEVITSFVKHRYELSKVISNVEILDKVAMDEDTKKKVMEECQITAPYLQVILGKLKKNKLIVDGKINPRYIPNIIEEEDSFKLMLFFDFS